MRLLKALLVGAAAGFAVGVRTLVIEVLLALWSDTAFRSGSGGLGAVSLSTRAPYAAIVGFAAGFYWQFRRR